MEPDSHYRYSAYIALIRIRPPAYAPITSRADCPFMFIPHNLITPASPALPELSSGKGSSPATAATSGSKKKPAASSSAPAARHSSQQKLLRDQLTAGSKGQVPHKAQPPATSIADLPVELLLSIPDHASPESIAQLSGVNTHFRQTLEEKARLASVIGSAAKLRDAGHFMALLDGTAKKQNKVAYSALDLPPKNQMEALEALGSNLINMGHSPVDQIESAEHFNQFMSKYRGQRSPLLNELEKVAKRALKPGNMTPDINWHFQVRQQNHFPTILARNKNGEALEGLMNEFGIATRQARNYLTEQSRK